MRIRLLLVALWLGGCATVAPPPDSRSGQAPPVVNAEALPSEQSAAVNEAGRPVDIVAAEPRDDRDLRNPAVVDLLMQAEQAIDQREPDRAVALAERAMLIDRYDPQVYLLLASAHRLLGNLALSRQYAARGLAYTEPGSLLYARLQTLQ